MTTSTRPTRRSRGFTLIELMVVLAIASLIAAYAARRMTEAAENSVAVATADNITMLGEALASYMANNTATLAAGSQNLTIAQLQAPGTCGAGRPCLGTFGSVPWTGGYTIRVTRVGALAPYAYEGLACTSNGYTVSGQLRGDLAGRAVAVGGGRLGMTYDTVGGAVGNSAGWTAPVATYAFANVAGKVCFFVPQAGAGDVFLRVDGGNQMLGNLQMGGNAIQAASTIAATGAITGGSGAFAGAVTATGAMTAGGTLRGANITTPGTLTATGNVTSGALVRGANVTATAALTGASLAVSGNANVVGDLGVNDVVASGNVTSSGSVSAATDVVITSLTSRANAPSTTSLKALAPTLVEINSIPLNTDGQSIAVPACASGGAPRIFAIPQTVRGAVNAGNWGADIHIAGATGGPWNFYAKDANGASLPAVPAPNFIALARIFCAY